MSTTFAVTAAVRALPCLHQGKATLMPLGCGLNLTHRKQDTWTISPRVCGVTPHTQKSTTSIIRGSRLKRQKVPPRPNALGDERVTGARRGLPGDDSLEPRKVPVGNMHQVIQPAVHPQTGVSQVSSTQLQQTEWICWPTEPTRQHGR